MSAAHAADELFAAMMAHRTLPIDDRDIGPVEGVEIRRLVRERFVRSGDRLAGHKIGLSAPEVQADYGVTAPGRGYLFASQVLNDGAIVATGSLRLLVEAEIAVTIARDIDPAGPLDDRTLQDSLAGACVSIEVVGTRWTPSPGGSIGAWTADNGMAAYAVPGHQATLSTDRLRVDLQVGDDHHSVEVVPQVLENLRWLVGDLAADGEKLEAGMLVLTGSLYPPLPAPSSGDVRVTVEGYGSVAIGFTP